MAASTWRSSQSVLRSLSPSSRFCSPRTPLFSSTSSAFASSPARTGPSASSSSSSSSSASSSPSTRVNLCTPAPSAARFSLESSTQKRTCMCSPSTHPGAFRCKLHRKISSSSSHAKRTPTKTVSPSDSRRIHLTKLAMMNSLARSRIVNGDLVKRALGNLVRPSSYECRSGDFRPRPSRLSVMSKAEDS